MKRQATRQDLKFWFGNNNIFVCNEIQHLLSYENADYYNYGVYGWNWDAFDFGEFVIVSGYRNTAGRLVSYDLQHEYNEKSRAIIDNWDLEYNDKKAQLNALIQDFIVKARAEK